MTCYTPLNAHYNHRERQIDFSYKTFVKEGHNVKLPCGGCLGCRLDRCNDWALRCMHESQLHRENCFITLTFDNDHLPGPSVSVRPFQLFMKKLRKATDRKIRYFHSTEYGDRKMRPHHHAILFGFSPNDLVTSRRSRKGNLFFDSPFLSKVWGNGLIAIGDVTHDSAAYTAAYTIKKDTKKTFVDNMTGEILAHEQMTCSRAPSIGLEFFKKFQDQYIFQDFILNAKKRKQRIPRAYMKYLESSNPAAFDEIKRRRESTQYERSLHGKHMTDEQRESGYKYLLASQKKYERSIDFSERDSRLHSTIIAFRNENFSYQEAL